MGGPRLNGCLGGGGRECGRDMGECEGGSFLRPKRKQFK